MSHLHGSTSLLFSFPGFVCLWKMGLHPTLLPTACLCRTLRHRFLISVYGNYNKVCKMDLQYKVIFQICLDMLKKVKFLSVIDHCRNIVFVFLWDVMLSNSMRNCDESHF